MLPKYKMRRPFRSGRNSHCHCSDRVRPREVDKKVMESRGDTGASAAHAETNEEVEAQQTQPLSGADATANYASAHQQSSQSSSSRYVPSPPGPPRSPVQARLHESYVSDRRYLREMIDMSADKRSGRIEAVLSLKHSLDASSSRIEAHNAVRRRRAELLVEQDARAHETLLSQGLNPYEVTRRREVTQKAQQERTAIERNIRDKQTKVLENLDFERVQQQRQEKLAAENRAYEKKYQREMGRAAAEERVQAYIVSRTGKETLDPTGKAVRIYPSQETPLKDNSFGLGKNLVHSVAQRKQMIEKVREKNALHHSTGPSPMLLPRQKRAATPDIDTDEIEREARTLPSLKSQPPSYQNTHRPGEDLQSLNHSLLSQSPAGDNVPIKLPPLGSYSKPIASSNQRQQSPNTTAMSSPQKRARTRSVLEEKMLADARNRQREGVFSNKQIVWGREFVGDAFRADPPSLWFKDFDVGKPMTLTCTLTNVSNTFNQFKLLEIEHMSELFEIRYERPGRMSAGMTCTITIVFTGDRREDIETWLPIAAPTGVTKVPVKCTCKKAVPILSASTIRFADVVAGDTRSIALRLENKGALSFKFRVERIASAPLNDTSQDGQASSSDTQADQSKGEIQAADTSPVLGALDTNTTNGIMSEPTSSTEENPQEASDGDTHLPETTSDFTEDTVGLPTETTSLLQQNKVAQDLSESTSELSEEELRFVQRAQSMTRFEPAGFDTPITFKSSGLVPPYSTIPVTFTFSPSAAMQLDAQNFRFDFFLERDNAHEEGSEADPSANTEGCHDELFSSAVVTVSAESTEVPIFVAHDLINIECCAYQKLYRALLQVGNRGKVALKMQLKPPKALADVIEFNPNEAYVQAAKITRKRKPKTQASFIEVQIKFRPRPDMWERIERKGLGSRELGILAVPIRVLVPDQRVPVYVILVSRITASKIELDPEVIAFGDCCVGHSVTRILTITNQARVPQRIAATVCPPEVMVTNDCRDAEGCADGGELIGAGIVLHPLESRRFSVIYQPIGALPLASATRAAPVIIKTTTTGMVKPTIPPPPPTPLLVLRSSTFNRTYPIVCSGMGVASPLVFSKTTVFMGATQLGQTQLASVLCTNVSDRWIQMELRLPAEASGKADSSSVLLRVTPQVTTLGPKQSVRFEFEFFAREEVFDLMDRPFSQTSEKANLSMMDETVGDEAGGGRCEPTAILSPSPSGTVGEPSVRVSKSRIDTVPPLPESRLSIIRDMSQSSTSRLSLAESNVWREGILDEPRSCHITWTVLCFRRIDPTKSGKRTPREGDDEVSLPLQSLTLQSTVLGFPQVHLSAEKLDFGQVALGQTTQLTLSLTNNGARDIQLRGQALHAVGAFRVINSTRRAIRCGGGTLNLFIEFAPRSPVLFEDTLELVDVDVPAKCPVFRIPLRGLGVNPCLIIDPHSGKLDFMDVLARSRSILDLTLSNTSGFPLNFDIVPWHEHARGPESKRELMTSSVSGLPVFSFSPSQGVIPARGSLSVKAVFHPDHSRPEHYNQRFRVRVPNESECHLLTLSGRCWENQLYVFAPPYLSSPESSEGGAATTVQFTSPTVFPAIEDLLDIPPNISLASLMKASASPAASSASPLLISPLVALAKAPTTITITLDGGSLDSSQVRRFFVGSTLPPPIAGGSPSEPDPTKTGASYSFELTIDGENPHAKLFTIEPMKGSVTPGQQIEVTATFHPPARKPELNSGAASAGVNSALAALFPSAASHDRPELQVSQWVELRLSCTLRGGFVWRQPPPPAASTATPPTKSASNPVESIDSRVVALVLRAKLQT